MFCTKCGNEIMDEAIICPKCGCATNSNLNFNKNKTSELSNVAMVFMIISTVLLGLYLIPLAWCLPMTIIYTRKVKNGEEIGIGFKICSLLFVSQIAGILMLCDSK